jgi:hypothetical protein
VFKRLRRNRHQLEKDAASSSAQTVTQKEAEPQKNSPCARGRTYGVQAQPQARGGSSEIRRSSYSSDTSLHLGIS